MKVKVGDKYLNDDSEGTFCGGKCIFKVRNLDIRKVKKL